MPPRSPVAVHIVTRVQQAMRKDRGLTFKQAARELGISESSLYKLRKGTRTGQGSIKKRVIDPPHRYDGQPQSVVNEFSVVFQTPDGSRKASRNFRIEGARTRADALAMRHDPRVKRAVQKQLEKEEKTEQRRATGSPLWRRKERQQLQVVEVARTVRSSKPSYHVDLSKL